MLLMMHVPKGSCQDTDGLAIIRNDRPQRKFDLYSLVSRTTFVKSRRRAARGNM